MKIENVSYGRDWSGHPFVCHYVDGILYYVSDHSLRQYVDPPKSRTVVPRRSRLNMKTRIILGALLCIAASAQTIVRPESDTRRKYEVTCSGTASATQPSVTLNLPSTVTGVRVRFGDINVIGPVSANVSVEWGGATPTGGTAAAVRGRNTTVSPSFTALCNASSSSPTSTKSFPLNAVGGSYMLNLTAADDEFPPGPVSNRTMRVVFASSTTGNYQFVVMVNEGY